MSKCRPMRPWLLVLASLICSQLTSANAVTERPLKDRIVQSDLVVVAVPLSSGPDDDGVVKFQVISSLKGHSPNLINVAVCTEIAEDHLDCCNVGKRYLLFLQKGQNDLYFSVNSIYGGYELP